MRLDSVAFAVRNESAAKRPRFVIRIEFDVESIYMTSHRGITGVPGVVMQNVLRVPSAVSQRIVPDEGRSEIGSFSFSLVDVDGVFTDEVRDKLQDEGKGLRGKIVRFYVGYGRFAPATSGGFGTGGFGATPFGEGALTETIDATFSQFQLFQTQLITDISYEDGVYNVQCADITREQRADIFDPKLTTLRDSIAADSTTIPVYSTTGFQPVYHGTSYSDAPSQKVGYIKVEDEWIRYPFGGIHADAFTGCTRGVLNTRAVAHTVDPGTEADRRPKVEEGIYLEMPAPKLAYAILTGTIYGTSPRQTLPPHWHVGINRDLVRLSDFTGIGKDLWDTTLDTEGFVVRFQGLKKTDGKKFLESELYMLLGCYSPIYSDGTIGLKRMNQVLADAAYVVELNPSNVVSHGALQHDLSGMHNRLQIDWNWNGDRFTRSTLFVDAQSIATHGPAPLKKLQFKGLHGSRHAEGIIRKRLDAFRDRYTSPPELITVTVLPSLNKLEIGDIVRLKMPNIRDFAGNTVGINRSFEIQRRSADYITGNVTLELFGSTEPSSVESPTGTTTVNEAFYNATGTDLSTVVTIVAVGAVGVIQPGTYNLPAGIYYYLGDLELANGATMLVNGTVQFRVRGFFTVNGFIDGQGRGKAGVADIDGWGATQAGTPGFLGTSRGQDGLLMMLSGRTIGYLNTCPCARTDGLYSAFPYLNVSVDGSSLLGIPADLAGTSGGAGGKLGTAKQGKDWIQGGVEALGGTGAASGAGLAIVSRGLAFGASGSINLSGDSPVDTSALPPIAIFKIARYPGLGGAGCPGGLLVLVDGSSAPIPDLGGHFIARTGTLYPLGLLPDRPIRNALPQRGPIYIESAINGGFASPGVGYQDEAMISGVDLSNVAYRVQYLPAQEIAQEDQDHPAAPTNMTVTGAIGFIAIRVDVANLDGDFVQIYSSITNNRMDALLISEGQLTEFKHELPYLSVRYYWARVRRKLPDGRSVYSTFMPSSPTAGNVGVARLAETTDVSPNAATSLYLTGGRSISGFSPSLDYHDLTVLRDGGGVLITTGDTTLFLPVLAFDVTAIITAIFVGESSTGGVLVHAYCLDITTAEEFVSDVPYELPAALAPITIQEQFALLSGHQYRVGVRAISDSTLNQEQYLEPVNVQVEVIKR